MMQIHIFKIEQEETETTEKRHFLDFRSSRGKSADRLTSVSSVRSCLS